MSKATGPSHGRDGPGTAGVKDLIMRAQTLYLAGLIAPVVAPHHHQSGRPGQRDKSLAAQIPESLAPLEV